MELIDKRVLIADVTEKKYESLKDITDYSKRLQKALQYSGFMDIINHQPVVIDLDNIISYLKVSYYHAKREYSEAKDNLSRMTIFNRKYKSELYRMSYNEGVSDACRNILNLLPQDTETMSKED